MRYIQLFMSADGEHHIAEQGIPFVSEVFQTNKSVAACVGVLDMPDVDASWIRENSEVHVDETGVTLKFKDPAVQAKLIECSTRHSRIIGGKYPVPKKVKEHLQEEFAHRSDLTMMQFKNLGFSLAEIKALPHFQYQARLAEEAKHEQRLAETKEKRLQKKLEKSRKNHPQKVA